MQRGDTALLSVTACVTSKPAVLLGPFLSCSPEGEEVLLSEHGQVTLCTDTPCFVPKKGVVLVEQGFALSKQHIPLPPRPGKLWSSNSVVRFVLTSSVFRKMEKLGNGDRITVAGSGQNLMIASRKSDC